MGGGLHPNDRAINRREGMTAAELRQDAAWVIERVRQHHPWARPDSRHWLALRWLEMNNKE